MRIVVTSAHRRCRAAIAILHRLAEAGHEIPLCLETNPFDSLRLSDHTRGGGWKRMWRLFAQRCLADRVHQTFDAESAPLRAFLEAHRITSGTVARASAAIGAKIVRVPNLNDDAGLLELSLAAPDVVVFLGGDILEPPFLEIPQMGVLHAHAGPLPEYRGRNATEWSLLHGVRPVVSVLLMNAGIDAGDVVLTRPISLNDCRSVAAVRGAAALARVEALLTAVDRLAADRAEPQPQRRDAGRLYSVMAEPLVEVLDRWLAEGRTPTRDTSAAG